MTHKPVALLIVLFFLSHLSGTSQRVNPNIAYQQYIEKYREIAVKKMQEYGIPASITLAQGLLESGSGKSDLAVNANNHFGIKCHKEWTGMTYIMDDDEKGECFRKYANAEESFNDHSLFLTSRPRYSALFALDIYDYKGWAYGLKSAGYATNPRYAEMLIKIIEENELFLYDSGIKKNQLLADKSVTVPLKSEAIDNTERTVRKDFEYVEVTNGNRSIYLNNGVRLTYAREGDNAESIADDLGIHTFQILQYNELGRHEKIEAGAVIYVEPKKKKGSEDYHIVSEGETMRYISQLYGIKLKSLYKKNALQEGHEPEKGTKIYLRKSKP